MISNSVFHQTISLHSDVQMASHEKGNEQADSSNTGWNEGYDESRSYWSYNERYHEIEPSAK